MLPRLCANNLEASVASTGLPIAARRLGWNDIAVIDDDLGRSGGGIARPGFEKLLAAICEGRVGAVVSIEASRLARNGRDWHTLLGVLRLWSARCIVDEDGVYDPRHPNDRLLLGMKGTMSEMELSLLRQRSLEALKQKARRGELFLTVAIGYVRDRQRPHREGSGSARSGGDRARLRQVRRAADGASGASLDAAGAHAAARRQPTAPRAALIEWKLPVYNTVLHILTNPIYAGAYAFGRTGRPRQRSRPAASRIVRGFSKERKRLGGVDPRPSRGLSELGGLREEPAPDRGQRQRQELHEPRLRCAGARRCSPACCAVAIADASCTSPTPARTATTGRYHCRGGFINHGGDRCISFGGMRIDRDVGAEVIERLQPLGIEAALAAQAARSRASEDKRRQVELALEQARYEVGRARRQYDAVDPDNRLVAAELETRWNERLTVVRDLEAELEGLTTSPATELDARRSRAADDARRRSAKGMDERRRDTRDKRNGSCGR